MPGRFWEKPLKLADIVDVGIRSTYVASWHAAPLLLERDKALIVNTSGSGAVHYVYGAAYGAHKASQDKMAADMAVDFAKSKVAVLSLWMGALLTDRLKALIASDPEKYGFLWDRVETPELTGHVIWALFNDPELKAISGQTLIGAEMAVKYAIKDAGGRQPPSYRETHKVAPHVQYAVEVG